MSDVVWRPEDDPKIRPPPQEGQVYRPDILDIIETTLDGLSRELRALSLDIHGNHLLERCFHLLPTYSTFTHFDRPSRAEVRRKVCWISSYAIASRKHSKHRHRYAHDVYTAFMEKHGFTVTKNYLLETAWVATYTHGHGGRVLGVNSEMDALPGIGHACGHNLIGISGVAVALAAKAAMKRLNIDGKVVLLGTPGALVSANICNGNDNTRGSRRGRFWQGHAV
jgi:hypothetical protein